MSKESIDHFRALQKFEHEHTAIEIKELLGLKRKPSANVFKESDERGRIYPGYYCPVIVFENNERNIKLMRYRVRPNNSNEEIPSKYNVFNARLDALEKRKTWQSIFTKNHCLFPFKKFYEWVEDENKKKKLISFTPQDRDTMWAPAIYDQWTSNNKEISFESFALLTNDPPKEVEEMGHDRCPIFLKENHIDDWLQPNKFNKHDLYKFLKQKEPVFYNYKFTN
ncbi:MAG: hypothetical protein HOO06_04385 [Bdellovibrionaceae bacterium]|nr:hypothetical protein [Pseudobdellovibrionaceae bacterium]